MYTRSTVDFLDEALDDEGGSGARFPVSVN